MSHLYVDNDLRAELSDLKDQDGAAVTGATVTVTIYENDGSTVLTGPLTLTHEGSGTYATTLPYNAGLVLDKLYWVKWEVVGAAVNSKWWENLPAERRYA